MIKLNKEVEMFLKKVGKRVDFSISYVGDVSVLAWKAFCFAFKPPFKIKSVFQQASFIGVDSFSIVFLVSLFTGIVLALQSAYALRAISGEMYAARLVALSMTRELGPVLTALIIAGRVGAAISAELGTMKVTEQIDALQSLATNPIKYLVAPRLVALVIMLPLLTVYSDAIGMLGGYIVGVWKLNVGSVVYLRMTFDYLVLKDIFTGLIKSVFFAVVIAIIGCYQGLTTEGGAEGVGKSTTRAVVVSFILIIAGDCLFTALFYFAFG